MNVVWVLDCYARGGSVETWSVDGGCCRHALHPFSSPFLFSLPDPDLYSGMIEGLEAAFPVEECRFKTIYGECNGWGVNAGRQVAMAIEEQTGFTAQVYNLDIRPEQRWLAAQGTVPCLAPGESRFTPDFPVPLRVVGVEVPGDPSRPGRVESAVVTAEGRSSRLSGKERAVLSDLGAFIFTADPDVVLMPAAGLWLPHLLGRADAAGIDLPFSRTGQYRRVGGKSYVSYGRTEFRTPALLPDGRVLIDTTHSFNYREGGLAGVILASRLTGIPPNHAALFTAGTLISGYEVYEAVLAGIAVPFRKGDPETARRCDLLRAADRGGMMFQPVPGIATAVTQVDFTSLYPSIIVQSNLSPETLGHPERPGFLPQVLAPLISLRRETKRRKREEPHLAGMDALLKWMLVTCFGYTGYRNAKFGNIEVHEAINRNAREVLLVSKALAERSGHVVLHGMVDCLFVQGNDIAGLELTIARKTGLPVETDLFDWIVFLPMKDGRGAYNRYYGRLAGGEMKCRGVASRRHDTPKYVKKMQDACFTVLERCRTRHDLESVQHEALSKYRESWDGLAGADVESLVIRRRVATVSHTRRSPEAAAVAACRREGIGVVPGMEIAYVVTDARHGSVALEWEAVSYDTAYYRGLVDRAWEEVRMAFPSPE